MIIDNIHLNIKKPLYAKLTAKQGDIASRRLRFHLTDGVEQYSLVGRSVKCYILKPDKTEIFNALSIVSLDEGICDLELTSQTLAASGIAECELVIIESGKKLSSIPFKLEILKSLNSTDAIESTNEFNALEEALNNINNYDAKIQAIDLKHDAMSKNIDNKHTANYDKVNASVENNANEIYKKWGIGVNSEFLQRKMDYVFGTEYLFAFHKKYATTKKAKVVFSGDSTTAGYGVESEEWIINNAFKRMAEYRGITGLECVNKGYLGDSTEHWNRTRVTEDIALTPDLYVVRWGINDPSYDKNLNQLADNGLNYDIRRNVDDFYKSLDEGLTKFRQAHDVGTCSIVLMTPNSTSDDLSFRNEKWHESINDSIRFLARKHKCVFIDTYRTFQDSRIGLFMDVVNNGHVHPLAFMNLWIVDTLFKNIFPELFILEYCKSGTVTKSELNLSSTWSEVGFGFEKPSYIKEGKVVSLTGLAKGTVGSIEPIGILPVGYRPIAPVVFSCAVFGNKCANITVNELGEVRFQDDVPPDAYSWTSLNNIKFYV